MNNTPLYKDRYEQFKDILKTHLSEIMLCSIYIFLFTLPTLFWVFFTALTDFFTETHILNVLVINLGITFTLPLVGLGFAGSFYVFKRLVFNDGTNINSDFFIGIRKNGKSFAKIFFIIGLLYLLLHISLFTIAHMNYDINILTILSALSYILFFLLLFVMIFTCTQTIIYQDTLTTFMKNGLLFTFGSLNKNLGIFIIILFPFIIYEFVPINNIKWMAILISGFFYFGFGSLLFSIYSNYLFDKTINIKQFPEIYRKGLIKNENISNNFK